MTVREQLYPGRDIYEGTVSRLPRVDGWDHRAPVFRQMLEEFRPSLIVELGTWVGGSALTMAEAAQSLGLSTEIVCVDTFLCDWNVSEQVPDWLEWDGARPKLYERFMENVMALGYQRTITPFVQTTRAAFRWFRSHGIVPDLVYVDAAHEYEEVSEDLLNWFHFLQPRAIFGHDFTKNWPGVVQAVRESFDDKQDASVPPFWIYRRAG